MSEVVIWHDVECGSYAEDLPLWRELARSCGGTVLDVGCGSGRVALDLARRGHEVTAVDHDADLVDALRDRAAGLPLTTRVADARSFTVEHPFALIVVPMQTVQLLDGHEGRRRFLVCARAALAAGGLLAIATCDTLRATGSELDMPPSPDMRELDGVVYSSRPLAVVDEGSAAAIHRLRERVDHAGHRIESADVVRLDRLDPATLESEGRDAGFAVRGRRIVPATDDYVESTVVMLRG